MKHPKATRCRYAAMILSLLVGTAVVVLYSAGLIARLAPALTGALILSIVVLLSSLPVSVYSSTGKSLALHFALEKYASLLLGSALATALVSAIALSLILIPGLLAAILVFVWALFTAMMLFSLALTVAAIFGYCK